MGPNAKKRCAEMVAQEATSGAQAEAYCEAGKLSRQGRGSKRRRGGNPREKDRKAVFIKQPGRKQRIRKAFKGLGGSK